MEDRQETVVADQTNSCKKHNWQIGISDPNSELISLICANCHSGISVAEENLFKYIEY
jgi:hypothetical protein